jgi:hypothetical protein
MFAESLLYQPCRARYERFSSVQSRLVNWSLCLSISRLQLTLLVDKYASFKLRIYSCSEISALKLLPERIHWIDSDICLTECVFRYLKFITCWGEMTELEGRDPIIAIRCTSCGIPNGIDKNAWFWLKERRKECEKI